MDEAPRGRPTTVGSGCVWHDDQQGRTVSASLLRRPEMAGVTMAVWEKRLNLPLVVFHAPAAFCGGQVRMDGQHHS
jgi:predicted aconitase with swiveling domain